MDKYEYKIVIDQNEFIQKVTDYIESGDIDKTIGETSFRGDNVYKMGFIQGLCVASIMLCDKCEPFCLKIDNIACNK